MCGAIDSAPAEDVNIDVLPQLLCVFESIVRHVIFAIGDQPRHRAAPSLRIEGRYRMASPRRQVTRKIAPEWTVYSRFTKITDSVVKLLACVCNRERFVHAGFRWSEKHPSLCLRSLVAIRQLFVEVSPENYQICFC
jgi:hypothetical protein